MPNIVVLATIFPGNLPFFGQFLKSLEEQTFRDFDLLIANDGVSDLAIHTPISFEVIRATGSPLRVRIQLMEQAVIRGYSKFVFADTDDESAPNRVEMVNELLNHYPVVCNDLDIINASGLLLQASYWKQRVPDRTLIDSLFLADKNCVGFGSVALTAMAFERTRTFKQPELPAPDWYFFYLLSVSCSVLFTTECSTRYRQHGNNTIGVGNITPERLRVIVKAKLAHYHALSEAGYPHHQEEEKTRLLQKLLQDNNEFTNRAVGHLKTLNINYFWWEETNFLNGSN
ncbi:MAG: hypothetical protein JNK18_13880 [Cyclobacteriaceae bacterium]|nr:hypothetical protein [Cyclobacteriaceae bacterium]